MWCPDCNREFDSGERCPVCGGALRDKPALSWGRSRAMGQLTEAWPRSAEGSPEEPVMLTHCSCVDMEDEITAGILEAYGIPCLRLLPGDGSFGKVLMGMSGAGVDIYVPESLYEEACQLLKGEPEDVLSD